MNIGRRINMSEHVCLTWSLERSFWSAWILLTSRKKKSCEILWNIYVNIKYIVRRINMSEHVCLTWSSKRSFSSVQIFTPMKQEKKILLMRFTPREASWISISNSQCTVHGAKIILKLHQNHCSIGIWRDIFKTFGFCKCLNMRSKE